MRQLKLVVFLIYLCRVPAECNSVGNKFGTRLEELTGKYLKTQEHSQMLPSKCKVLNISGEKISNFCF